MTTRILVEGRPGAGKTTAARRLAVILRERDVPVRGFTTEEIRVSGRRVGFAVNTADGQHGVLAHVDFRGPPRVGRYGVDLPEFERVALASLHGPATGAVVLIDELGKMELASVAFRNAVQGLLESPCPLVATVHAHHHPFTDALKRRMEVIRLGAANRDRLPEDLADRVTQ